MDRKTANEMVAGGCGLLVLGDRTFVVSPPTDHDMATLAKELRRLAKLRMKSPLESVQEDFAKLDPAVRALAVESAVKIGGKAQAEPTTEFVAAQMYEPEACRFWCWWLARKHDHSLTLKDFEPLVTEANVYEVLLKLRDATDVSKLDPNSTGRTCSKAG